MADRTDGGPAFPRPTAINTEGEWSIAERGADGMTLRDYFAGQALKGLLSMEAKAQAEVIEKVGGGWLGGLTEVSYRCADFMLAQRAKREDGDD